MHISFTDTGGKVRYERIGKGIMWECKKRNEEGEKRKKREGRDGEEKRG